MDTATGRHLGGKPPPPICGAPPPPARAAGQRRPACHSELATLAVGRYHLAKPAAMRSGTQNFKTDHVAPYRDTAQPAPSADVPSPALNVRGIKLRLERVRGMNGLRRFRDNRFPRQSVATRRFACAIDRPESVT